MRKILKMASLPLLVFLFIGLSATPVLGFGGVRVHSLPWAQGWDIFTGTLNPFPASRLTYFVERPVPGLNIGYFLSGSNLPSRMLLVNIISYLPSTSDCIPQFGTITGGTGSTGSTVFTGPVGDRLCETPTRQGVTASEQQFAAGILATDASGSGFLNVTISGIPKGEYDLAFGVLTEPSIGTPLIFQSPGPFGISVLVRIHNHAP